MHGVVRAFRATFVEGRFVPLFGTLGFVVARLALFFWGEVPDASVPTNNYLWNPVAHLTADPDVSFLASTLSVFLVAWILARVNNRFNLTRSRSSLPFVIPLFLFSSHPYFLVMNGDWIALIFTLMASFPLLESYQKPDSYLYSFRAAVLIGLASLFQVYALVSLPLWWRGEQAMRGGQSRAFVSSLFGLFLVYASVFSIYFLRGDIQGFMQPFFSYTSFSIPALPAYTIAKWGGVLVVGLFFVINMILAAKIYSRDKVLTLTFTRFAVFLIITLLLLQVAYWVETLFFLLLALSLIAYLNAYLFTRTRAKGHIYLAYGWAVLTLLFYLTAFYPFSDFLL
jgi:hypothetical protein